MRKSKSYEKRGPITLAPEVYLGEIRGQGNQQFLSLSPRRFAGRSHFREEKLRITSGTGERAY